MCPCFIYTALGDSITEGFGAFFLNGFAYRLSNCIRKIYPDAQFINYGIPGLDSQGLLQQLRKSRQAMRVVKRADMITITIGGNNLLDSARDNYYKIDNKKASIGAEKFRRDWPKILYELRYDIGSAAEIYVMTVYNPYKKKDSNYESANYYVCALNSIIKDPMLKAEYNYQEVDVYKLFKENDSKEWNFFYNRLFRNPHPNIEGNRAIARVFRQTSRF